MTDHTARRRILHRADGGVGGECDADQAGGGRVVAGHAFNHGAGWVRIIDHAGRRTVGAQVVPIANCAVTAGTRRRHLGGIFLVPVHKGLGGDIGMGDANQSARKGTSTVSCPVLSRVAPVSALSAAGVGVADCAQAPVWPTGS